MLVGVLDGVMRQARTAAYPGFRWAISVQLLDDAAPELVSSRWDVMHVGLHDGLFAAPRHSRCLATAHFMSTAVSGGELLRGFLVDSCCQTTTNGTPAERSQLYTVQ